jgi:hypothetical protein
LLLFYDFFLIVLDGNEIIDFEWEDSLLLSTNFIDDLSQNLLFLHPLIGSTISSWNVP